MTQPISDRELFDALREAGFALNDAANVMRERNAGKSHRQTLRDEFAKAALQGLLSDPDTGPKRDQTLPEYQTQMATAAYGYADAMLIAREKVE